MEHALSRASVLAAAVPDGAGRTETMQRLDDPPPRRPDRDRPDDRTDRAAFGNAAMTDTAAMADRRDEDRHRFFGKNGPAHAPA